MKKTMSPKSVYLVCLERFPHDQFEVSCSPDGISLQSRQFIDRHLGINWSDINRFVVNFTRPNTMLLCVFEKIISMQFTERQLLDEFILHCNRYQKYCCCYDTNISTQQNFLLYKSIT